MEEGFDFIEGDDVHPVVQVGVAGAWDDHQFLVIALQFFESVFAEVTGVGFLAVDDQDGVADLPGVREQGHIYEGKAAGHVPAAVGVQGTLVVAPGAFCSNPSSR